MAVEASITELQKLAKDKLDETYTQLNNYQKAVTDAQAQHKKFSDEVTALDAKRTAITAEIDRLTGSAKDAEGKLTGAQQAVLDRLAEAERQANAAIATATAATSGLQQLRQTLHALRERVRGVVLDAIHDANDHLTEQTAAYDRRVKALEDLVDLITKTPDPTAVPATDDSTTAPTA